VVPHAGPRCWAGHRRDRALSKTLRPAQGLRCTIGAGYWSTPHSDHRQRRPGAVGPDPLRDQGELFEPMASDPTLWWTLDEKRGRRVLTLDSRVTGRLEARQPERTTSSNCVGVTDSPVLGLAARRSRRSRPFVLLSPGTEAPIRHPRPRMRRGTRRERRSARRGPGRGATRASSPGRKGRRGRWWTTRIGWW